MKGLICILSLSFLSMTAMADDHIQALARVQCSYPGLYQGQQASLKIFALKHITTKSGYAAVKTLEVIDEGYVECSSLSNVTLVKACEQDISNTDKLSRFYGLVKFYSNPGYAYYIDRFTIETDDWERDKKECLKAIKRYMK